LIQLAANQLKHLSFQFPAEAAGSSGADFAGIILKASLNGAAAELVAVHRQDWGEAASGCRSDSWRRPPATTWTETPAATISEAFGSSARQVSVRRAARTRAGHALARLGAAPPRCRPSARGSHGLIELRTESARLVVMVTTPSSTRRNSQRHPAELSRSNRRWQRAKRFARDEEPEAAPLFRPRFIGTIAGLAFNGNEVAGHPLSRFVKVRRRLAAGAAAGAGSLSSSGDAVEVSAGVLVRRLEGRKNLTVFLPQRHPVPRPEYINNDKVVQDVLSQFIGIMSESKFYNLIFRFSPGE
uniref:Histone ubiquitination proteins group n=1 Tax=Macrostomum lignano TaxID=282301 RepID=A0A1I8F5B9_9PLAT